MRDHDPAPPLPLAPPALPWPAAPGLADLRARLAGLGAREVHIERVLRRWLEARSQDGGRRPAADFLPAPLLAALPQVLAELDGLARPVSEHPGEDGSARLLVALADGQAVESVLLLREGLCISSQVGCAVGCTFCMTGQGGLVRQLGSAEMLAQVALARRRRPVRKVVFMGMGEPAHNLDAVLETVQALGTLGGIGHKNLVVSSVGDARLFERLMALGPGAVRPALALSLHTTRADLRERLLPRAPRISPADLLEAADAYARASGYPLQVQWTLLAGINDRDEDLDAAARLLAGRRAVLNLIPYNTVDGLDFQRPEAGRAAELARRLHRQGVLTKLRQSAGQDVDGGCGQLRARAERPVRLVRPAPATTPLTVPLITPTTPR